jgi:phage shock protein A
MLNVLKALLSGASARADEALTDHFAIDLIEQKIREADAGLNGAKNTLASLIIRQRNEERHVARLDGEIADLERRTGLALADGQDELASEAAAAIAELVNERAIRQTTCAQLAQRVVRTQTSVAKANRRLVDLRQGMISARAIDAEHRAQRNLSRSIGNTTAMRDAEALIKRVMNQDDPLEESDVLDEIDAGLNGASVRDRLAQAGYGDRTKVTGGDILARLKAAQTIPTAQ